MVQKFRTYLSLYFVCLFVFSLLGEYWIQKRGVSDKRGYDDRVMCGN